MVRDLKLSWVLPGKGALRKDLTTQGTCEIINIFFFFFYKLLPSVFPADDVTKCIKSSRLRHRTKKLYLTANTIICFKNEMSFFTGNEVHGNSE